MSLLARTVGNQPEEILVMLNKAICLRCYKSNEFFADGLSEIEKPFDKTRYIYRFNQFWEKNICPCTLTFDGLPLKSKPPEKCLYILEQTINAE
jgi:hypothetical protein